LHEPLVRGAFTVSAFVEIEQSPVNANVRLPIGSTVHFENFMVVLRLMTPRIIVVTAALLLGIIVVATALLLALLLALFDEVVAMSLRAGDCSDPVVPMMLKE
jgi:hypothetical protein